MPGVPGGAPGSREADQKPEVAWMLTSEDLLRVLCERLLAAARSTGGPSQSGEGLPLEIRDDAVVIAEYHLDWPGSQPQQLAGVPLGEMKLHYVRAEQTTRLSTLESYYKRQLGTPDVHAVENGSWIDSLRPVPESDWKRSIDLLFTATVGPDEELDKKQELPITLDVLCIDIKDPARAAQGN
jgi:hypothetical protein